MENSLDISWKTILKVLITGFALYLAFLSRHIILWLLFAVIISLLVEPIIKFLRRIYIPKFIAVALVYLSILAAIGLIIYFTAPILIFEVNQFMQNIPDYFAKVNPFLKDIGIDAAKNFDSFSSSFLSNIKDNSSSIIRAASVFFGGVSSTIFIFTLAFFISLEEKGLESFLVLMVPKRYESTVVSIAKRSQFKVAAWFGVRILACLFVGAASFVVLFLLGVKYAFILSLISGVLNFVPYIGPAITSIIVLSSVGVSGSWIVAIYAIVALLIVQQIENNLITPLLSKKFLDFPPVLVLLSLLIGGTIFGFLGMIFLVPVAGIIYEFVKEFLEKRKNYQQDSIEE